MCHLKSEWSSDCSSSLLLLWQPATTAVLGVFALCLTSSSHTLQSGMQGLNLAAWWMGGRRMMMGLWVFFNSARQNWMQGFFLLLSVVVSVHMCRHQPRFPQIFPLMKLRCCSVWNYGDSLLYFFFFLIWHCACVTFFSLFICFSPQSQPNQATPKPAAQVSTVKPAQFEVAHIPLQNLTSSLPHTKLTHLYASWVCVTPWPPHYLDHVGYCNFLSCLSAVLFNVFRAVFKGERVDRCSCENFSLPSIQAQGG